MLYINHINTIHCREFVSDRIHGVTCAHRTVKSENLTTMGINTDSDTQSPGVLSARHERGCLEQY